MWVAGLKVGAGAGRTEVRDRVGVRVSAAYCKATERIVSGQYSITRCR